jgi:phospholipid-binding lipoprotein MlaA
MVRQRLSGGSIFASSMGCTSYPHRTERIEITDVMNHATRNVTVMQWMGLLALTVVVGCARSPGVQNADDSFHASDLFSRVNDTEDAPDYDPWRPFNEVVFTFNHDVLDGWIVRPTASGWQKIMPAPARRALGRAFDNLDMPRRLVNNILQLRPLGAGRELSRFVVNTTAGVGGLFDVAGMLHIEPSDADTGQTLALYGVGAGPYVVLPATSPRTLRDAIGTTADGFLDPLGYFIPFFADQARAVVNAVNDRSLQLQVFADVEESVLDLYTAARNGYLQRRRFVIREAAESRDEEWRTESGWFMDEPDRPVAASIPPENPS